MTKGSSGTDSSAVRNQSISRAFQVIEAMARSNGPLRLQDVGKTIGLPPSTVLRFLRTLMDHGYVEQDPETLRYFLTLKICMIGEQVRRQVRISDIVHPHLLELSASLGEATSLAVERDKLVVYVDVVDGPDRMLQTLQRIGRVAPMNSTGVGKALLIDASAEDIDALVRLQGLPELTPRTITSRKDLLKELEATRSRGYAIDDEECEAGVRCLAVPIRDYTGLIVAAVSTTWPTERLTIDRIGAIGKKLVAAGARISETLGHKPR